MRAVLRDRRKYAVCLLLAALLYFLNNALLKPCSGGLLNRFCRCWLNDMLAPVCLLSALNIMLAPAGREVTDLRIILLIGLAAGIFWETAGPVINPRLVADPWDVAACLAGSAAFAAATGNLIPLPAGPKKGSML